MDCGHCGKPIEKETLQDVDHCPHCGEIAMDDESGTLSNRESCRKQPTFSRQKVWRASAIVAGICLLGVSIFTLIWSLAVPPVIGAFACQIGLILILAVLVLAIVSKVTKRGWRMTSIIVLTLILCLFAAWIVLNALGSRNWTFAYMGPFSIPLVFVLAVAFIVVSWQGRGIACPGDIVLTYIVMVFAVIFLWLHIAFRYTHCSPHSFGPLRGFLIVILILAGPVLAIVAIRKTPRGSRARIRTYIALGLVLLQAPVVIFVVWANINIDEIDWHGDSTRALGDCRNISTAILLFNRDTGMWPIHVSADHDLDKRVDFLYGNMGDMPGFTEEAWESWGSRSENMYFTLVTDGRTRPWYRYPREIGDEKGRASRFMSPGWNGPYLPYVTDDPWGFAYLVSVSGFEGGTKPDNHVWCLSAGPDNIVETPAWATETRGDDIGYLVVGYVPRRNK